MILRLLRIATFLTLFGRAWRYIFWDSPLRSLFWDESIFGKVFATFGIDWEKYATNPITDTIIVGLQVGVGLILMAVGFYALFCKKDSKLLKLLPFSSLLTFGMVLLTYKSRFFQFPMLIEHAAQVLTPSLFYLYLKEESSNQFFINTLKAAICLTFNGHGFYAIGAYPVPGNFIDMVIAILQVPEQTAISLLVVAAVFDFFASTLIFHGNGIKPALYFCTTWGLLTSLARIVANFDSQFILMSFHQWGPEVLVRLPHFFLPLVLLLILRQSAKN
jgi:hypothetical protein